jgi:hypothetical protein
MNQKSLPSRREVFKELTPYATPNTAIGVRLFVIDFGLVFIGIFGVIFAPWFVLKVGGVKSEVQHLSRIRCRNERKNSVPATAA